MLAAPFVVFRDRKRKLRCPKNQSDLEQPKQRSAYNCNCSKQALPIGAQLEKRAQPRDQ